MGFRHPVLWIWSGQKGSIRRKKKIICTKKIIWKYQNETIITVNYVGVSMIEVGISDGLPNESWITNYRETKPSKKRH